MPRRKNNAEGEIRMRLGPLATKLVLREADGLPVRQDHLEAVLQRQMDALRRHEPVRALTLNEIDDHLYALNDQVLMLRRLIMVLAMREPDDIQREIHLMNKALDEIHSARFQDIERRSKQRRRIEQAKLYAFDE